MVFKFVLFIPNMRPSASHLVRMLLNNLLPDALPMLLLQNRRAVTLNELLHQLYLVFCGSVGPLPC